MSEPLCLSNWDASGTLFAHRQTPPRHLYRRTSRGLISLAAKQRSRSLLPSQMYQPCRNQNLAPIEWLCGGWPRLLCPSCSDPFRGVLPWAPRACSKRVLLAVQSSCVVVFTVDSLRFADATSSRMEPDLTRSPPDSRSISYLVINTGSRAAAQQNPLSLSAAATGCRSSYASHSIRRSVDG